MDILRLQQTLMDAEGLRLTVYQDHLGVWTIGYGTTYWLGKKVTSSWGKITKLQAEAMLNAQMIWAVMQASKSISNWNEIGGIRQEALSEIVYQIGASGWLNFAKTRVWIETKNWTKVRQEFLRSKLADDTPKRALRYANMLYYGD